MKRMNNRWGSRLVASAAFALALGLAAQVLANTTIRNAWVARYATPPSGTSQSYTNMLNNCNLCHATGGGSNYNQYGWQIRTQIQGGASATQALINVEHVNADGVAGDNLAEILASAQPGWTSGAVNTIYINNSGSTLTSQLPAALINPTVHYNDCPADSNHSGAVDVDDLITVILTWGCTNPPGPCGGDVNGSGVVDVDDLIAVILAWGPCQ